MAQDSLSARPQWLREFLSKTSQKLDDNLAALRVGILEHVSKSQPGRTRAGGSTASGEFETSLLSWTASFKVSLLQEIERCFVQYVQFELGKGLAGWTEPAGTTEVQRTSELGRTVETPIMPLSISQSPRGRNAAPSSSTASSPTSTSTSSLLSEVDTICTEDLVESYASPIVSEDNIERPPWPGEKQLAEDKEQAEGRKTAGSARTHSVSARKRPGDIVQSERAAKIRSARQQPRMREAPQSKAAGALRETPRSDVSLLARALRSRVAIQQFCSLVKSRRSPDNNFRFHRDQNAIQRIATRLGSADDNSAYARFILRLSQCQLAAELDSTIMRGFVRVDSAKRLAAMKRLGWTESKFERFLAEGRKWNRICSPFDGLLCFIALTQQEGLGLDARSYQNLQPADLADLHGRLDNDYFLGICKAGKAFQDSLNGAEDVEFVWESSDKSFDVEHASEETMLAFLQPYQPVRENVYEPAGYPDWHRPEGWPVDWPWPANPTSEGVHGCSLCDQVSCSLVSHLPGIRPRIKCYGEKGRGLQAVGETHGTVAYPEGALVGWLFGKIVPANTSTDDTCVDFVRTDIEGQPVVCQLECRDLSNCFRLLNHDCRPSAHLKTLKVSCRYVVAVIAKTDILDGMEITISYRSSPYGEGCLCATCNSRGFAGTLVS